MEHGGSMPQSQGLSNIPILSRIVPIPRIDTYLFKVHSNIVLPSTPSRLKGLFPAGLPVNILKALLPSSILATWPAHLNILDFITLIILGERYKLWSSSLSSLLHFPFSSHLGPNIRLRILFLNTVSLHSSLNVRDHNYSFYYLCSEFQMGISDQKMLSWRRLWIAIKMFFCQLSHFSKRQGTC